MKNEAMITIRCSNDLRLRILKACGREPGEHGRPNREHKGVSMNKVLVSILEREFPDGKVEENCPAVDVVRSESYGSN